MGALHTLFHTVRRKIQSSDIKRHIVTGSTANVVQLIKEIQRDSRWVERLGDSIYFRAFFLNIRQPADNMVVFEVNSGDRKMADAFDTYLVVRVGELDLCHSQPVTTIQEVGK